MRTFEDLLPDLKSQRLLEDGVGVGIGVRTDPPGEEASEKAAPEALPPPAAASPVRDPPSQSPSSSSSAEDVGPSTVRLNPSALFAFLHKLPIASPALLAKDVFKNLVKNQIKTTPFDSIAFLRAKRSDHETRVPKSLLQYRYCFGEN